jgi:hypothetical protein
MKVLILILMIISNISIAQEKLSWTFTRELTSPPRGGTTTGIPVTYDQTPSRQWLDLKEKDISTFEKDRRAILALQGEYEVSFEFLETLLLQTEQNYDTPYASRGTEFIIAIKNEKNFISLQHILVMFKIDPETGEEIGPLMVKHWRQDWSYRPKEILEFNGDNTWSSKKVKRAERSGVWKWDVYQVDDTPRYAGLGKWNHFNSVSTFQTGYMSRPLPRREFSVRDDYKVLMGTDTIVVSKDSWIHEQKNFKQKNSMTSKENSFLAREIGHNSYKRIKNFDFSSGYEYWNKTSPYWNDVSIVWQKLLKKHQSYSLKKSVNGMKLFMYHFKNAEDEEILSMSSLERQALIKNLIESFIK